MKLLKDPTKESYGISYCPYITEEFEELIDLAKKKIEPFSHKEISRDIYYFRVRDEEVSSEFDCCDDEKCVKEAKKAIREQYGKGTHVEECYSDNDGDHENIETCSVCGKPLNEYLTWCKYELEILEEHKPWTIDFIKEEGFTISVILESIPTMDYDISGYARHQGGEILQEALQQREDFFQRILLLVQVVNTL
jgi:hypothetical protein